jgi:hypothetical protein
VAGHEFPGSLLFFLLVALFSAFRVSAAEPYHVSAEIRILSEYAAEKAPLPPSTEIWRVGLMQKTDHAWGLSFFLDEGASGSAICKVTLSPGTVGRNIEFQAPGMEEGTFEDIMILSNFPAPCDVLPVKTNAEDRVYTQRRSAGGARFMTQYRIVRKEVAPEEAMKKGWIKEELPIQAPLTMISVVDDRGRVVVKQLWPRNGEWWLYEENDYRRSWLINAEISHEQLSIDH